MLLVIKNLLQMIVTCSGISTKEIKVRPFISFNLFNTSLKHNLAPYSCHVLFMFMFAFVSIINIYFHVCFAHFMFLFFVFVLLFYNRIILSCSLFGN